eukprot:TRINITY_DN10804_c0_g1_i1.p2 TRINITY_DN10804_c0_g1~~TRINITY_DN10804_c0_g1_i1.p2  ORF type:complete len:106 (-),score=14.40 TRINITY_DN10804_c0_g1_i1:1578-1895(-)
MINGQIDDGFVMDGVVLMFGRGFMMNRRDSVGFDGNWTEIEELQKPGNLNFQFTRSTTLGGCRLNTHGTQGFSWELEILSDAEIQCTRSTALARMSTRHYKISDK